MLQAIANAKRGAKTFAYPCPVCGKRVTVYMRWLCGQTSHTLWMDSHNQGRHRCNGGGTTYSLPATK